MLLKWNQARAVVKTFWVFFFSFTHCPLMMRLFKLQLEFKPPCLRLINSSWRSLQVICFNSRVRNHTSRGSRNNLQFGRGNWNAIFGAASSKRSQLRLNKIYSMMYWLALNAGPALGRTIGLYLPGYEVWGHAFPSLMFFVIFFFLSGHWEGWNNAEVVCR